MPHPTGPTSERTRKLIAEFRKSKDKMHKDMARYLERSARSKGSVNLKKISKLSGKNKDLAVPGKVLGVGEINKAVHVYALSFSKSAKAKIEKAGGKAVPLNSLLKDNVKARMVK